MERKDWWQAFISSGRVEDYLRYRGVQPDAGGIVEEGATDGTASASDDRRPDHPGVSHRGGE